MSTRRIGTKDYCPLANLKIDFLIMATRALKLVPEPKKRASSPSFLAIKQEVEKSYGPILRPIQASDQRRIPTGPFTLDWCLRGGMPARRLWLSIGHKGCYKTSLTLIMAAAYQRRCSTCLILRELCQCENGPTTSEVVFIDAERALDEDHAIRLGIDPQHFSLFRPPHGEAACEYAEKLSRAPEVGLVIVDSLAALVSESELEAGYMDPVARGLRARLISRMMRALINHIDCPTTPKFGVMLNHILPSQDGKRRNTFLLSS